MKQLLMLMLSVVFALGLEVGDGIAVVDEPTAPESAPATLIIFL